MINLDAIRAQIRGIGRGALVGMLMGLVAAQSFAHGGPTVPPQPSTQQDASAVPSATRTVETNPNAAASLPPASSETNTPDLKTLLQAPQPIESASINKPPAFDPMIGEAARDGQSLQSAPGSTSNNHKLQRPGMLVLGIVGAATAGFGAYVLALPNTAHSGGKNGFGAGALAAGATGAGFGFYFAFHQKK